MSTAAKTAGLAAQNSKMNHPICKMSVSCRLDTGVPGNFVMQLSGHSSIMSDTLSKRSMSNNGTMSILEEIFRRSLFSAESQMRSSPNPPAEFCQGRSFLAGVTMNNCVFNIIPSSSAKHSRIDYQK